MSNTVCEFCNKQFSNIYILKNHLKSSKKCLSQRTDIKIDITEYNCEWCNKSFLRNNILSYHKNTCILNPINKNNFYISLQDENNNNKNEIGKLKNEIENLKDELKEQHDKFIEELLLTQEKYREEKQLLKDEILVLKTELRMINENMEVLDKKEDKYLGTIKDVAVKPSTNNKITNNTVNNISIQQKLDKLPPLNDLAKSISSHPDLPYILENLETKEPFYLLCAKEISKFLILNDSSRGIASGRLLKSPKPDTSSNIKQEVENNTGPKDSKPLVHILDTSDLVVEDPRSSVEDMTDEKTPLPDLKLKEFPSEAIKFELPETLNKEGPGPSKEEQSLTEKEYVNGKIQGLISKYLVDKNLVDKAGKAYNKLFDKFKHDETGNDQYTQDCLMTLLDVFSNLKEAYKNKEIQNEDMLNDIVRKTISITPKTVPDTKSGSK